MITSSTLFRRTVGAFGQRALPPGRRSERYSERYSLALFFSASATATPNLKSSFNNPPSKISSRRGAPPGNLNALKHGFYSRQFKKSDLAGLENCDFDGLKDEITIMRVYIRRLIQQSSDSPDLYETAGVLRILCLATANLTRLIKTQHLLISDSDDPFRDLRQALEEISQEIEQGTFPSHLAPLPPTPGP
jgi:hypothetical protein